MGLKTKGVRSAEKFKNHCIRRYLLKADNHLMKIKGVFKCNTWLE